MAKTLDKTTTLRAITLFTEWFERTGDHRVAADRAGVSERTGRRWRLRFAARSAAAPTSPSPAKGPPEVKTNLAPEATRFVGRRPALAELRGLFARGARLVTVLGPGGIGKTRLVARYADLHLDDYARDGRGGVWFCDLTEARSAHDIAGAVAHVLGVPLTASGSSTAEGIEQLGRSLDSRGPALLVLDNFEQAAEHARATVGRWLELAPKAHFLVTSRVALALAGEVSWHVESLGLPSPDDDAKAVAASEAVELFVDRARLVRPEYTVTDADAHVVGELVRQLDGIPLAIELAAARMAVLPPAQLLTRLRSRFDLLAGGAPGVARRQTSMRAAIDWSWQLLSRVEQSALAQCSVFHGGFTLEAAEKVVHLPAAPGGTLVLDVVHALRQRSLLRVHGRASQGDALRLGVYESIREFAAERLRESGADDEVAGRHARYYVELGSALVSNIELVGRSEERRRLAAELDNLSAAWSWALERRPVSRDRADLAVRSSLAMIPILSARGPRGADFVPIDAALSAAPESLPDELRVRGLVARGEALRSMGRVADAFRDIESAASIAASMSDARLEGLTLTARGRHLHFAGRLDDALDMHDRALALARRVGDRALEARALGNIAIIYRFRARLSEGLPVAEQALAIAREIGHGRLQGDMLSVLATMYQGRQRIDDARASYEASLAVAREVGDRGLEAAVLGNLGTLHQELGEPDQALEYTQKALAIFRELGMQRLVGSALGNIATLLAESGRIEEGTATCRRAIEALREAGDRLQEGVFLAHLAGMQADLGFTEDARATLESADRILGPIKDDPIAALAPLMRGHIDLALAREAEARGDDAAGARHRDAARARTTAVDGHPSDDVRTTLRVLRRAIDGVGSAARKPRPSAAPAPADALVVSEDARVFRAPAARAVNLERRHAVRLILRRLVEHRLRAPGEALAPDALLDAGWPGERVLAEAGASRVYVALATLRKLGLRGLLVSRDGGYLLDPDVELVVLPHVD